MKSNNLLRFFYLLFAVFSTLNGIWMIYSAFTWYSRLPAGIADTGPFNGHFVRDIGLVYFIAGLGCYWSANNLAQCRIVHFGLTLFFLGHALMHVVEILLGTLPPSHWWLDLPGVFVPGLLMLLIALPPVWQSLNPRATESAGPK